MACAKPSDCAPCSKCPEPVAPVMPRCDVVLNDGVYTNATVSVEGGCIVSVVQGTPLLYQPDNNCAGTGGTGGEGSGLPGEPGPPGQAATIQIGTVTSLPAGAAPTVTNVGTPNAAILNIGIPRGADGEDGAPPGGASSTDGGIILDDGAIKSPLPVAWPPVLDVLAGPPVGAGITWSFTKNPANGLITAAIDVSALITTFNNQITALTDEIDAQQLQINDLITRVEALEAGP